MAMNPPTSTDLRGPCRRKLVLAMLLMVGGVRCMESAAQVVTDEQRRPPAQPAPTDRRAPPARDPRIDDSRRAPEPLTRPLEDEAPDVFDLGAGVGLAAGPESALITVGGYIDSAMVRNRFRLRFDAAYDNPVPDRNQFFYPEDGPGGLGDETRIDFQDITGYLEWSRYDRFSLFVELPIRFLNPELNPNTAGFADMNAGFKYSLWECPEEAMTFQFRTYAGTGNVQGRGLGVGFASLEPSLLYQRRLSDRLALESEFRVWIPLSSNEVRSGPFLGEDFSGEVLRFGVGLGYDLYQSDCCSCRRFDCCSDGCTSSPNSRLTSVVELVGWTILGGFGTFADAGVSEVRDVTGDTIVNLKVGGRWTSPSSTTFVGWGHAITSDVWYSDILRAEYEVRF